MKAYENNTATAKDWIISSQNITLPEQGFFLISLEDGEVTEPGDPVELPANIARKMFSHTEPGLPPVGHGI